MSPGSAEEGVFGEAEVAVGVLVVGVLVVGVSCCALLRGLPRGFLGGVSGIWFAVAVTGLMAGCTSSASDSSLELLSELVELLESLDESSFLFCWSLLA